MSLAGFFKRGNDSIATRLKTSKNPAISLGYLHARSLKRRLFSAKLNFVSLEDMLMWTHDFTRQVPNRFDVIVGVPRSGLMVASIMAVKFGRPLATPDMLKTGDFWKSQMMPEVNTIKSVLIVDDSVRSGGSMESAKKIVSECLPRTEIVTASIIIEGDATGKVDYWHKIVHSPRMFEWNLLHSKMGMVAMDLDGVLCADGPKGIEEDEGKYVEWIRNATPYLIPSFEVDAIVSNRLEKYRAETENWLKHNGVRYRQLLLWDLRDKSERKGRHGERKAEVLLQLKPIYFVESAQWEAEAIWELTKIPTFCVENLVYYN